MLESSVIKPGKDFTNTTKFKPLGLTAPSSSDRLVDSSLLSQSGGRSDEIGCYDIQDPFPNALFMLSVMKLTLSSFQVIILD